jgi:3-hydroxyisobutyrate dehydrogenase
VITMLPDGKIVRDVLLEAAGGALAAAAPGTLVIDMSSSSPIDTVELGKAAGERGFPVVDAPVSGGVKRAIDGSLAIMAGGEAADVERARAVLQAMGKSVFATGPLGSGHAMKALNNYVSAAGLAAAAEAIIIGRHFGLAPDVMVDVLNASTGRNNSTEVKMKQHVLSGSFASGFAMGLMAKDLRTAADLARHAELPAPLSMMCEDLWRKAFETMGSGADHTEIFRYLEGLERP